MADDGGWIDTTGTEFGEVDNPNFAGNSMASWDTTQWNVGSGGANLAGWDTQGVALPNVPLGTTVKLRNPDSGAETTTTVVDSGPGKSTGAGIDMLAGTRSALGYPVNYKGPVQYQVVSGPAPSQTQAPTPQSLSSQPPLFNAPTVPGNMPTFSADDAATQQPQQQQKPQGQQQQPQQKPLPAMPQVGGMQTAQLNPELQQKAQGFAEQVAKGTQNPMQKAVDYTHSYDVLSKYFGEEDGGSGQSNSGTSSTGDTKTAVS